MPFFDQDTGMLLVSAKVRPIRNGNISKVAYTFSSRLCRKLDF